jgi:hypothetical protein
MATTIVTKSGSGAPTASDLVAGELAVDLTNKRLYTEDSGGTVLEVGSNPYNFTANHDGSAKLATTATGIDVTGSVTATGDTIKIDSATHAFYTADRSDTSSYAINRYYTAGTESWRVGLLNDGTSNFHIYDVAGSASKLIINTAGNVGIGTASPVSSTGYTVLTLNNATNGGNIVFQSNGTAKGYVYNSSSQFRIEAGASTPIVFANPSGEAMRIDASGNLLVATTSTATQNLTSGGGTVLSAAGGMASAYQSVSASDPVLSLNNTGVDSSIITLRKDGATVGSIGSNSGYMVIGSPVGTDAHLLIGNGLIHPATSTGGSKDNAIDIGGSSNRFKDLYLSGGVVFGTTGGSVTSKTLDDYEEGTWTPTFLFLTGVSSATGSYVKVGNLVTVSYTITSSGTTVITLNSSRITNLPFTISAAGDGRYVGSFTDTSASSGLYGTHTLSGTTAIFTSSVSTGGSLSGSFTYRSA